MFGQIAGPSPVGYEATPVAIQLGANAFSATEYSVALSGGVYSANLVEVSNGSGYIHVLYARQTANDPCDLYLSLTIDGVTIEKHVTLPAATNYGFMLLPLGNQSSALGSPLSYNQSFSVKIKCSENRNLNDVTLGIVYMPVR